MHDLTNDNLPYPVHVDAPSWHPSHISMYEGKLPFLQHPRRVTTPPFFPDGGLNFTNTRVIEMPPYQRDFLDKNTIWREPLFQIGATESTIAPSSSTQTKTTSFGFGVTPTSATRMSGNRRKSVRGGIPGKPLIKDANEKIPSSRESRSESFPSYYLNYNSGDGECWSYQALSSTSPTFTTDPNRVKPSWHFKDLRAYFNQR